MDPLQQFKCYFNCVFNFEWMHGTVTSTWFAIFDKEPVFRCSKKAFCSCVTLHLFCPSTIDHKNYHVYRAWYNMGWRQKTCCQQSYSCLHWDFYCVDFCYELLGLQTKRPQYQQTNLHGFVYQVHCFFYPVFDLFHTIFRDRTRRRNTSFKRWILRPVAGHTKDLIYLLWLLFAIVALNGTRL